MAQEPASTLNLADMKRQAEKQVVEAEKPKEKLTRKVESFEVRYNSPEGMKHAVLQSKIMGGEDRLTLSRLCANMGGSSWDSIPPSLQARIYALAVCTVQLQDPPRWVYEWMQMDDALLDGIYTFLVEHEQKFFRTGSGEGEANTSEQRVVVSGVESPDPTGLSV